MARLVVLALVLAVACCLGVANAIPTSVLKDLARDIHAAEARNLREKVKNHYYWANTYQRKMFEAEDNDDVEKYEYYLYKMRAMDKKFIEGEKRYNQMRDQLEQRIRTGMLVIDGFELRTTKGTVASIVDHVIGRVNN